MYIKATIPIFNVCLSIVNCSAGFMVKSPRICSWWDLGALFTGQFD